MRNRKKLDKIDKLDKKKRPEIRFLMFSGSRIPLSNRGQFVEIQIPNDTFNFNVKI